MKRLYSLTLSIAAMLICINSFGQAMVTKCTAPISPNNIDNIVNTAQTASTSQSVMAKNAMATVPLNYKTFTRPYINKSAEAAAANTGYENHPEAGMLFPGTPCDNCYELIGKRTETTKTFQKEGVSEDGGKDVLVQTSNMAMHYRDAAGNWRTITTNLGPDNGHKGVYAAMAQPVPVIISAAGKFSSLGTAGETIRFNNNLELIYVKTDGSETSLGSANWGNHTAGDEGVYVTNAWPGIDIEMHTSRGAVKTNFLINHAMPAYADGQLLIRDHIQIGNSLSLTTADGNKRTLGRIDIKDNTGNEKYFMSAATVFEHNGSSQTAGFLEYALGENNTLDIALPGSYLNKPAAAYPVVIDPLVSLATTVTPINGASYNALWTAGIGCTYLNAAMTPPNCTITDVQFQFAFTTTTIGQEYVGYSFYMDGLTCRSPGTAGAGASWSCLTAGAGTCSTVGAVYSIFTDMQPCLPTPSCASVALNITMYFYQNWNTTPACSTTYVTGSAPFVITVVGHTVELTGAGVTGTPATICPGENVTLAGTGTYGVPPYTYSWLPGPITGSPAVVNPTVTTTYSLTVTDHCGITTAGTATITVNPTTPITGTLSMCIGNTSTLADGTAGGTWSSSTPTVATIAGTGIVTGVTTGTSTITYTTAVGCKAYAVVTVTPLPVAITGSTSMCQGYTTTLNDVTPAGAWSSSTPAIATVSATGLVTGIAGGTATITYGTPGCATTITVTVNPTPATPVLANNSPLCSGDSINLTANDATAGVVFSWKGPAGFVSALPSPFINSTGMSGTYIYTVTAASAAGCISLPATTIVTINPTPAITLGAFTNPTTCGGTNGTISLEVSGLPGNTEYVATYLDNGISHGESVTSSGAGAILVTALDSGTFTSIYLTSFAGCRSNKVGPVTLTDPPPPPAPVILTNEPICVGQTLDLAGSDAVSGGSYKWVFPGGATSTLQDPEIINTVYADSGVYKVTYDFANCFTSTLIDLAINPPTHLINVSPNSTIPYGSSIQLNVDGALYYWWANNDGTLSNPNMSDPIATPTQTTTYSVVGTSISGCKDTAEIVITVTDPSPVIIPTAFTPNNDGLNDVFRLASLTTQKLVEFSVFNRWGQLVYHNTSGDAKSGWDGTFNGTPADMGVYNYFIIVSNPDGTNQVYKGDVTLIR